MAEFKEIQQAFYTLVENYATDREGAETKSQIEKFAKLLPADPKERITILKNLNQAVRADAGVPGKINLPRPIRKDINTVLKNLQAEIDAFVPKPSHTTEEPDRLKDEHTSDLDATQKKQLLDSLYKTFQDSLQTSDAKNIAITQRRLSDKNKEIGDYAAALRKATGVPKEISDDEIIDTCRRATENYTLKKFRETFKQWADEMQAAPEELKKEDTRDYVKKLRKRFKQEMGYELQGKNGKILHSIEQVLREASSDDRRKDRKKKGEHNMADDDLVQALNGLSSVYDGAKVAHEADSVNKNMAKALEELKESNKAGYDLIMAADDKALEEALKDAKLTAQDEFKASLGGALYAHKNQDKFKDANIPADEWADIISPDIFEDKKKKYAKPDETRDTGPTDPTKPLEVDDHEGKPREHEGGTKEPWVERKQKWFDENIKPANPDYQVVKADTEFEVKFAGGTIHYESETKATVSKDASYKVYEALLKDPDNASRPVQFPENASEHLTNMLYAASILNQTPDGKTHEMIGLDKSKLNMDTIEKALKEAGYGDAEIKKVKDYYDAHEGKPAAEDEHKNDDHGAELSDVVKGVKADSFKRTANSNRFEFTPEPADKGLTGTYDLETGKIEIMRSEGDVNKVIYSSEPPSAGSVGTKPTQLTEDEIAHIKEQAKPAMEKEVRDILADRARMKELEAGGLIEFRRNDLDGSMTFTPKDPTNEESKKAYEEYSKLHAARDTQKDNAFIAQVMSNEPDVLTKIHNDTNTPQSQKDVLVEKMNSYNNVSALLKQRAELLDKGEDKLDAKEKLALTKNYIALLSEYKKDPTIVEVAMADDLKRNNSAERAKVHEDVKSEDKKKQFEEYMATMKDYSKQAHEAVAAGGKLPIQDYMKAKYPTLSPEDLDKRTKAQIQFNNAYQQYRSQQKGGNTN